MFKINPFTGKLDIVGNDGGGGGGGYPKQFRVTLPGELIADTDVFQGMYYFNDSGSDISLKDVSFAVGKAAASDILDASISFNIALSDTAEDINIGLLAFDPAIELGTDNFALNEVPANATNRAAGTRMSVRIIASVGSVAKAQDGQVIINTN